MDIVLKNGTTAYNVKNKDLPELEKLGLVDETTKTLKTENTENICALCGKPYSGYGNSTWGYWELFGATKKEDTEKGEKERCCDGCNKYYVIPARMQLAGYGVKAAPCKLNGKN